jgi:hypothetical protein
MQTPVHLFFSSMISLNIQVIHLIPLTVSTKLQKSPSMICDSSQKSNRLHLIEEEKYPNYPSLSSLYRSLIIDHTIWGFSDCMTLPSHAL